MDLKNLIPTTSIVELKLKHPFTREPLLNDDDTPMTITLYAVHSKEYKAILHEQTNVRLKKAQGNKGRVDFTAEDLEESTIDLFAKATKDWDLTFDGAKLKFSIGAAKDLYMQVFWMRDQIEEEISNSLDFTKV
jgi:hypothetical protein